jgi:hypothetical protein
MSARPMNKSALHRRIVRKFLEGHSIDYICFFCTWHDETVADIEDIIRRSIIRRHAKKRKR